MSISKKDNVFFPEIHNHPLDTYKEIFHEHPEPMCIYTPVKKGEEFILTEINKRGELLEGMSRDSLIGLSPTGIDTHQELQEVLKKTYYDNECKIFPTSVSKKDTICGWRENRITPLHNGDIMVSYKETTEPLEKLLQVISETKFRKLYEQSPQGMVSTTEECSIINANKYFCNIIGYQEHEIKGEKLTNFIHYEDVPKKKRELTKIKNGTTSSFNIETRLIRKSGRPIWCQECATMIIDEMGENCMLFCIGNIQKRKKKEEILSQSVLLDSKTGLLNSEGFYLKAEEEIKKAYRDNTSIGILYCDLDGLKETNDNEGHIVGDIKINTTSNIIKKETRETDLKARVGGDEFAILLRDWNDIGPFSKRLTEELENNNISLSLGISQYQPNNPKTIEELIKEADYNMLNNKKENKKGRN